MKKKKVNIKGIRKNSILLMVLGVFVMGGIGFVSFFERDSAFQDNFSTDSDDEYNLAFTGGEFNYRLALGESISLEEVINSFKINTSDIDYTTFKLVSNSNKSVVKFDNKTFTALSEGEAIIEGFLNDERIIFDISVNDVNASNASINGYSVKGGNSPRFNATITSNKLRVRVWDNNGINTEDIALYKVDANRNIIKQYKLSFASLNGVKKYECCVLDSDALSDTNNYFYIVVSDKHGNKRESYFSIIKTKSGYSRNFAPRFKNFKVNSKSSVSFDVIDGSKIKSFIVYDLNNSKKVVLSKKNFISTNLVLNNANLVLGKNNRYNLFISIEDVDGNLVTFYFGYRFIADSTSSTTPVASKKYKVLINPSHQIHNSTTNRSNPKYKNERENMYTFAAYVKSELEARGYDVYVSPKKDGTTGLNSSKQIKPLVKKTGATKENVIYLALHSNAGTKKRVGPVVYYYKAGKKASAKNEKNSSKSKKIAKVLCSKLTDVYNSKWTNLDSLIKSGSVRMPSCLASSSSVSEPRRFYQDAKGEGAAALIEIGYHDNAKNQKFLENYPADLAKGIADAVDLYLR